MRAIRTSLLAGTTMIVFAGFARAQGPGTHVLTIHLPGGGAEQIRYVGDVPPEVFLETRPALVKPPLLSPAFGPESPFVAFDRISEEMDRRAASLLQQAAAMAKQLPSDPDQLVQADFSGWPPNGHSYAFVSTMSARGVCGRSVEITSSGNGGPPRVMSRSFGQCGGGPQATAPASVSVPPKPKHRPYTIMVDAKGRQSVEAERSGVKEAAWRP